MAGIEELETDVPVRPHVLRSASRGDREAFRQLFDALWSTVYSAALRLTKSPEMAQDLAQEVFIKLWDSRADLGEIQNIRAYLYTITRNLTHDYLRKQVLRDSNKEFMTTYFSLNTQTPEELLEQKELGYKIETSVKHLPEHLRNVFTMSYVEGLSHKEIGRRLGITTVTSRVYLVRALTLLRKDLIGKVPNTIYTDLLVISLVLLHYFLKKG